MLARLLRALPAAGLVAVLVFVALTVTRTDSAAAPEPGRAMAGAAHALAQARGVRFRIGTDDLPDGVLGLSSAEGTLTRAPAFRGEITAPVKGLQVTIGVVAAGGTVYAKMPFVDDYTAIDPADYGVPDPSTLLDPDTGIPSLLAASRDVRRAESVRGGPGNREVLTAYHARLSGRAVAGVIPGSSGPFRAVYTINDHGELVSAVLTGHFNGAGERANTYTVTVEDYLDHAPRIEAP